MTPFAAGIALVLLIGLFALALLRRHDEQAERTEWQRLAALQPAAPDRFAPKSVADLPEPAQRYFGYTIRPGTPLLPVAEIKMRGRLGLGSKADPGYQPMRARQILAGPAGFVWIVRTRGAMRIRGSDSGTWTRFSIFGLLPVARMGGGPDHVRSAFARAIAEAAFWTPAALLPRPGVRWDPVDARTARVTVRNGALEQAVDVTVDPDGRPVRVALQRWSRENADKVWRLQPFGGYLSDFREVGGYRLPFRVEGGNLFETDAYYPFYIAEVETIRFPGVAPPTA